MQKLDKRLVGLQLQNDTLRRKYDKRETFLEQMEELLKTMKVRNDALREANRLRQVCILLCTCYADQRPTYPRFVWKFEAKSLEILRERYRRLIFETSHVSRKLRKEIFIVGEEEHLQKAIMRGQMKR